MSETPVLGPPLPTRPDAPVSSPFGIRVHPQTGVVSGHTGTDYAVPEGTPVGAIADGEVMFVGRQTYTRDDGSTGGAGNYLIVRHGDEATGYSYSSAFHLRDGSTVVREGDQVVKGQTLAEVGSTGGSTGPHLHQVYAEGGDESLLRLGLIGRSGARFLDPEQYLGRPYLDRITIQEGDKNAAVERLQERLVERDLLPPGAVDGDFGPDTRRAVEALQRERGLAVDGVVGQDTRDALGLAPAPSPPPEAPTPPAPGGGAAVLDTAGPFAAVSTGDLVGVAGGTPLGALSGEQSYALARGLFGDGPGAAALETLDWTYGTGDGTLVQREVALGLHEGRLNVGRENADPSSGYNIGTFQIGGRDSTPDVTRERYEGLVGDGVALYERLSGQAVDRDALSAADRDVFAHIGHVQEKGAISATSSPDDMFSRLADASLRGDALAAFVSDEVQVGDSAIGRAVVRDTDPRGGVGVDLDAVAARAAEPDVARGEPSLPVLDPAFAADYSPAAEEWQRTLRAAGYDVDVDGNFGPATTLATERAQRDAGLAADGVVGPATWEAYASARAQAVEPEGPDAPPAPPEPVVDKALGAAPPEDYSVRQFERTVTVGTWDETAARVGLSGDDARWVADTEAPGAPGVQLTFPGTIDPADATLVAPPGSRAAAALEAAGDDVMIRQSVQDGSPGTYVVVPREAILAAGYESADAFVAEARGGQLALQAGGPVQEGASKAPFADAAEDPKGRPAPGGEAVSALFLRQLDDRTAAFVGRYTSGPEATAEVVAALNVAAREDGILTPDHVRETVRTVDPASKEVPTVAAGALGLAVEARAYHASRDPEAAAIADGTAGAGRPEPGGDGHDHGDGAGRETAAPVLRAPAEPEPAGPTL